MALALTDIQITHVTNGIKTDCRLLSKKHKIASATQNIASPNNAAVWPYIINWLLSFLFVCALCYQISLYEHNEFCIQQTQQPTKHNVTPLYV